MIKNIDFVSKQQAESLLGRSDHVVISISDPDESVSLKKGWKKVLSLKFLDVENEDYSFTFCEDLAKTAAEFIREAAESDESLSLIVHCHAGVSRSAGMALAAHAACPKAEFPRRGKACYANRLVVFFMENELGAKIIVPECPEPEDDSLIYLF